MMMRLNFHQVVGLFLVVSVVTSGCTSESLSVTATTSPTVTVTESVLFTPIPTVNLASATPAPTLTRVIPTPTPTMPVSATSTMRPTEELPTAESMQVTITQTEALVLEPINHYWLQRPIAQDGDLIHWFDRTYPYGGTQFGTREVHLGVEFVNTRYTPVLAAANGVVLFAGMDDEVTIGPVSNYYGNVVVVLHDLLAPEGGAIATLYGHLQDIAVTTGQTISAGDRVGRVGDSGIAIGPHLHFEVRVGDWMDYRNTRNPDLWILPYREYGVIAGYLDADAGTVVRIRSDQLQRETYVYGSEIVNPDPLWQENFTIGDLPAGTYEVFVSDPNGRKLASEIVDVQVGVTNWVRLQTNRGGN